MVEKKQYPSQINSKTISARIPVQDYVNFLNESIKLGISLNDFLLRKIYSANVSNSTNNIGGLSYYENVEGLEDLPLEILNFIDDYSFKLVPINDPNEIGLRHKNVKYLLRIDENLSYYHTIQQMVDDLKQYQNAIKFYKEKIEELQKPPVADLSDVKNQLTILIQEKFDYRDRRNYRKELFQLLKELE